MRNLILSSVLLGACASNASLVASRPAVGHYDTDIARAKSAVHDVLATNFYVNDLGTDAFATKAVCRTENGDVCHGRSTRSNAWTPSSTSDGDGKTFALQLFAKIVPNGDGVIVSVGATLGGKDAKYTIGSGNVPAWMQNQVEEIQKEIREQIKMVSPNG